MAKGATEDECPGCQIFNLAKMDLALGWDREREASSKK